MKKTKLTEAVTAAKNETGAALQLVWDEINKGQQKQLVKIKEIKTVLDRYGVNYDV